MFNRIIIDNNNDRDLSDKEIRKLYLSSITVVVITSLILGLLIRYCKVSPAREFC